MRDRNRGHEFVGLDDQGFGNRQHFFEHAAANSHAARSKETHVIAKSLRAAITSQIEVARLLGRKRRPSERGSIDFDDPMAHNAGLRILLERLDHNAELIFLPPIVAIQKGDDLAAGLRNAEIKGARLAAVFLPQISDARGETLRDRGRGVCRAVVHEQNLYFVRREILLDGARDGALHESLVVVRID